MNFLYMISQISYSTIHFLFNYMKSKIFPIMMFYFNRNKMKTFFRKKGLRANKSELHKSFYSLEGKLLFARKNSLISRKWSLDIYLKELN